VSPPAPQRLASRGRFITIEGPDGGGKTTQAERLAAALRDRGQDVLLTREPGGTRFGERIRAVLLDASAGSHSALADALLFSAARIQLVTEALQPALAAGRWVVCARYADSTLAYQGYGGGVPLERLRALEAIATGGLRPDRTVLLDVPAEVGLARKGDEQTRFESAFDLGFHQRVRTGFLALAAAEPDRFRVVDARDDAEAVFAKVLAAID
jgi:dTMP kinase